jgi:1-acyl-sn-glycerol-3-phosphate acyltransferase
MPVHAADPLARIESCPLSWRDPKTLALLDRLTGPLVHGVFRFQLRGVERVPPPPCLFVANHSGVGIVEVMCLFTEWHRLHGETRPAHGLASDVIDVLLRPIMRAIGAMPASPALGLETLRAGRDLLVFPGGEIDCFRPFYAPRKVEFGSRRGYVRLALESGVPVLPVATIGSHLTYPMFPGGFTLARVLGLKRFLRAEVVPLPMIPMAGAALAARLLARGVEPVVAAALFVASLLPIPARVTSEILPPLDVGRLTAHLEESERIEEGHRIIHGTLQDAVSRLRHDGRTASPVL